MKDVALGEWWSNSYKFRLQSIGENDKTVIYVLSGSSSPLMEATKIEFAEG